MIDISVEIKQTGSEVTGTASSHMGTGKIDGGKVSGKAFTGVMHAELQGQIVDFKIDGTLDGGKMTGTLSNPAFGSIPFSATKGN